MEKPSKETLEEKLELVRGALDKLCAVRPGLRKSQKQLSKSIYRMMLERGKVVDGLRMQLKFRTVDSLLWVEFSGEEGIDAGAVTTAMYSTFFEEIYSPQFGLFSRDAKSHCFVPLKNNEIAALIGRTYKREQKVEKESENEKEIAMAKIRERVTDHYVLFGLVLANLLLDQRTAPVSLPKYIYKYLTNEEVLFSDYQEVDPEAYNHLKNAIDSNLHEDLDFVTEIFGELSLSDIGKSIDRREEKNWNVIEAKAIDKMVSDRSEALLAVREGYFYLEKMNEIQKSLTSHELQLILCGKEEISPQDLIGLLKFDGFSKQCNAPDFLLAYLKASQEDRLRRFLWFVTELRAIPVGGLHNRVLAAPDDLTNFDRNMITVQPIRRRGGQHLFPQSNVCFYQLLLPELDSFDEFVAKLDYALLNAAHIDRS